MQCHELIPKEFTENNVPLFSLVHRLGNHYTSQIPGSELHMGKSLLSSGDKPLKTVGVHENEHAIENFGVV